MLTSFVVIDWVKQVYEEITGGADEIDLNGRSISSRAYCGWYNFKGADQQKKVGVLSGRAKEQFPFVWVLGVFCYF